MEEAKSELDKRKDLSGEVSKLNKEVSQKSTFSDVIWIYEGSYSWAIAIAK